jgi:hypothetical protein
MWARPHLRQRDRAGSQEPVAPKRAQNSCQTRRDAQYAFRGFGLGGRDRHVHQETTKRKHT